MAHQGGLRLAVNRVVGTWDPVDPPTRDYTRVFSSSCGSGKRLVGRVLRTRCYPNTELLHGGRAQVSAYRLIRDKPWRANSAGIPVDVF